MVHRVIYIHTHTHAHTRKRKINKKGITMKKLFLLTTTRRKLEKHDSIYRERGGGGTYFQNMHFLFYFRGTLGNIGILFTNKTR